MSQGAASPGTVRLSVGGSVATIVLHRPEKLNALNITMAGEFVGALDRSTGLRSLVVTGAGDNFSAGADITDLSAGATGDEWFMACASLASLPIPTIAAIEGYCLGGGLLVALCCDLRVAGTSAKLGTPEVLRGIAPFGAIARLRRAIGTPRAKQMMLSGRAIDAETAERWGLVHSVVEGGRALDEAVRLAQEIAEGPPLAMSEVKRIVSLAEEASLNDALEHEWDSAKELMQSDDAHEGLQAFREQRSPRFVGR